MLGKTVKIRREMGHISRWEGAPFQFLSTSFEGFLGAFRNENRTGQ
jgi:hypothetical protein